MHSQTLNLDLITIPAEHISQQLCVTYIKLWVIAAGRFQI